jgi:hypothetical protein
MNELALIYGKLVKHVKKVTTQQAEIIKYHKKIPYHLLPIII